MTNGWVDIKNADVILIMGSNAAENHPCGFKWAIEAKKNRNAKLVSVDPRYTRTSAVSDLYAPIRPGTDIAFLNGDRKSTRLNSSHVSISYAVFCLKKKKHKFFLCQLTFD